VFCARIADHPQPWFRFIVADETTWTPYLRPETSDAWIVEDTLSSLVAADPGDRETEQHLPEAASAGVFEAWTLAQEHIYRSWSWLTDVANLQPDVPLALREAADLVANHGSHLGVEHQRDLVQRLNGRWDKRIVDRVRGIVRSEASATERIEGLIEFVSEVGLEAPPPPIPLPVIEPDDVRLVCWMAVSATG
jgi:hypothetical protein